MKTPRSPTLADIDHIPIATAEFPSGLWSAAASPKMRFLFTGGADGVIRKFDLQQSFPIGYKAGLAASSIETLKEIANWDNDELHGTAEDDDEEDLSDIISHTVNTRISPVYSLAVQSECLWCLSGMKSGNIVLWSARHNTGTGLHTLSLGHSQPVSSLVLSDSETKVLSGGWDKRVIKWDLETGSIIRDYHAHKSQITCIETNPVDSNIFLSASFDGVVAVWDHRSVAAIRTLDPSVRNTPPFCLSACWSADGQGIFCGRRNELVDEWNCTAGAPTDRIFRMPKNSGPVSAVKLSKCGNRLVCASYDCVRVWNLLKDLESSSNDIPFRIVPGQQSGMISTVLTSDRFMATVSGNRGLQGIQETNQCIVYEIR